MIECCYNEETKKYYPMISMGMNEYFCENCRREYTED